MDDDPTRPLLAWSTLLAIARGQTLAAVLVPDAVGLRPPPLVWEQLRYRCARDVGAPLLLATIEPHHTEPGEPTDPQITSSSSPSSAWFGAAPGAAW